MSADSPYKTLSNIRSAIIKDAKETTASTMVTLVDRWINEGNEQVTFRKKRDWLDQQFTVQVSSAVQAVCSVTNGSTTVTFTGGITFVSSVEKQFYTKEFEETYDVASSTSNVIKLAKPFLGTSNTAANGVVFQSSVILDSTIRTLYQAFHGFSDRPLMDMGPQQMRALQESNGPQQDYAQYMSIFGTSGGSRRLVLFPAPLKAYTLYLDVNCFVPVLSLDADEPAIPMQYRQVLYWYGLYKLWLFHRNDGQAQTALANFNSMLTRMDGEMRSEIEFPQISVAYPKRSSMRPFTKVFDPRYREEP